LNLRRQYLNAFEKRLHRDQSKDGGQFLLYEFNQQDVKKTDATAKTKALERMKNKLRLNIFGAKKKFLETEKYKHNLNVAWIDVQKSITAYQITRSLGLSEKFIQEEEQKSRKKSRTRRKKSSASSKPKPKQTQASPQTEKTNQQGTGGASDKGKGQGGGGKDDETTGTGVGTGTGTGQGTGSKPGKQGTPGGKPGDSRYKDDKKRSKLSKRQVEIYNDMLDALHNKPPENEAEAEKNKLDRDKIINLLESVPDEDRLAAMKFLSEFSAKNDEAKSEDFLKQLQRFLEMSEAERQMLRTNRALHPDAEPTTDVPEEIKLALKPDDEKVFEDTGKKDPEIDKLQRQIDAARSKIRDRNKPKEEGWLDKLFGKNGSGSDFPFFNELLMFEGLLIGASEKNPEIKAMAQEITHDISVIRALLQKEIVYLAAESAASAVIGFLLAAPTAGGSAAVTSAKLAHIAYKLKRLRDFMKKVEKIYQIINTVRSVVNKVQAASNAYQQFEGKFNMALDKYRQLQALADKIDANENIEDQIEALEDILIAQMEEQLKGKLGGLLQQFYIPEDVNEEQLLEILFNMPAGVDAFKDMLSYYDSSVDDSAYRVTLLGKGIAAGALLYPVVGFLAAKTQEKLSSTIDELNKTMPERLVDFVTRVKKRPKRRRKGRKKDDVSPSRRKRRRNDYDKKHYESQVLDRLKQADRFIETQYTKEGTAREADISARVVWSPTWFRTVTRRAIKKLPSSIARTPLRVRKKKGGTESVPMPRIKARDWDVKDTKGDPKPGIHLSANPKLKKETEPKGNAEVLDAEDLRKGIKISGDKDERKAILKDFNRGHPPVKVNTTAPQLKRSPRSGPKRSNEVIYEYTDGVWRLAQSKEKGLTRKDPIDIVWHKPYPDNYPGFEVTNPSTNAREQFFISRTRAVTVPDKTKQRELTRLLREKQERKDFPNEIAALKQQLKEAEKRLQANEKGFKQFSQLPTNVPYREATKQDGKNYIEVEKRFAGEFSFVKVAKNSGQYKLITAATKANRMRKSEVENLKEQLRKKTHPKRTVADIDKDITNVKQQLKTSGGFSQFPVGVASKYRIRRNHVIQKAPVGKATAEREGNNQRNFQDALTGSEQKFKFIQGLGNSPPIKSHKDVDMDHVIDLAFKEGKDKPENLWPLPGSLNVVPNQVIDITKWEQKKGITSENHAKGLYSIRDKKFNNRWFRLVDETRK
jgi:hypothetical protein